MNKPIGVLALQGDFKEHATVISRLGHQPQEVRNSEDLKKVSHLIIPGGESTVISQLLSKTGLDNAIVGAVTDLDLKVLGTCAGAIVLSKNEGVGLIDMDVKRNAYGRQVDSFFGEVDLTGAGKKQVSFIRAPKIVRQNKNINVLGQLNQTPVLVRQGNVLVSVFHSELSADPWLHRLFLRM